MFQPGVSTRRLEFVTELILSVIQNKAKQRPKFRLHELFWVSRLRLVQGNLVGYGSWKKKSRLRLVQGNLVGYGSWKKKKERETVCAMVFY